MALLKISRLGNSKNKVIIHHAIELHNIYQVSGDTIPIQKTKTNGVHVPSFLPAYSLCNSDSNSISVNSYKTKKRLCPKTQPQKNHL